MKNKNPNSLGNRVKIKMGLETPKERKKRVAREKKENAKAIQYFKELHEKKEPLQSKNIVIPIDWMKKEFYKTAKIYILKEKKRFVVDDDNRIILDIICRYFANDPSFEEIVENGELRKGLMLISNCGTGKSSIFDIIQHIGRKYNIPQLWFGHVSSHTVATEFTKQNKISSGESVIDYYTKGKVCFDDLGSENMVNDYGIKKELMREVLELRYNRFKTLGTKTFCSTNHTIDELVAKYDKGSKPGHKRIEDRIYGMFNILPMYGKCRR
ncbi:hypothetical protein [Aquimarina algiphila]|uniref:hypothetical protein n=1 Tax=Aquimarina algiphila TaxID=2047982 RepID=UPI00232B4126|nr:hypothetical protein [Aquimarina algiphila]